MPNHLHPNMRHDDTIVVATVFYCDDDGRDEQTVIRLHPETPYFSVDHFDAVTGVTTEIGRFYNIVEAVDCYAQNGGDL